MKEYLPIHLSRYAIYDKSSNEIFELSFHFFGDREYIMYYWGENHIKYLEAGLDYFFSIVNRVKQDRLFLLLGEA